MPDPSSHFILAYFMGYTVSLRSCAPSDNLPHFQVSSSPRPVFYHQLHSLLNLKHDGSVSSWIKAVFATKQRPDMVPCWRVAPAESDMVGSGGIHQACDTSASVFTVHISLPILLLIDLNQEGGQEWNCADRIIISQKTKQMPAVVYHLIARVFHSTTKCHYISRFRTNIGSPGRPLIYQYDSMLHDGYAQEIPGGKLASHLAGRDSAIQVPPSFSTAVAVYQLHGGTSMQKGVLKTRLSQLSKDHQVQLSHGMISSLPTAKISLDTPKLRRVSDGDRYWLSETRRYTSGTSDYIWVEESAGSIKTDGLQDHGDPERKEDKRLATLDSYWTKDGKNDAQWNVAIDTNTNTGESVDISVVKPQSPSVDHVAHAEEENTPAGPTANRLRSRETSPILHREDSPLPFRCRCGASIDESGDRGPAAAVYDGLEVIRCDHNDCRVWSHLSCQYQGRASKLRKNGTFFCDDCDPRYVLGLLKVHQ